MASKFKYIEFFKNTGYNTINIPQNISELSRTGQPYTYKSVALLQYRNTATVTVRMDEDEAKQYDYCIIYNHEFKQMATDYWCYTIGGYTMDARDTCTFLLLTDFVNSLGGIESIANTLIDGYVERRSILAYENVIGEWCADDELLTCNNPLQADTYFNTLKDINDLGMLQIVTSTIDLYSMGDDSMLRGVNYTVGSDVITVPRTKPATTGIVYGMDGFNGSFNLYNIGCYEVGPTGESLSITAWRMIREGMQRCRDLGVESSILEQYEIPKNLVRVTYNDAGQGVYPEILRLDGKNLEITSPANMRYDAKINPTWASRGYNKRILYGKYNRYVLQSVNGNKTEVNVEDIDTTVSNSPRISVFIDPRPDGRPYFSFSDLKTNGGTGTGIARFQNAIAGEQWRQVPLVWTSPSHSVQDNYNISASLNISQTNYNADLALRKTRNISQISNFAASQTQATTGFISNVMNKDIMGSINSGVGMVNNAVQFGVQMANNRINDQLRDDIFRAERERELYNFGVSQTVVEPNIQFPYTNGCFRDFVGNGYLLYKLTPSSDDLSRHDNILNAYGTKVCRVVADDKTGLYALLLQLKNKERKYAYLKLNAVSTTIKEKKLSINGVTHRQPVALWERVGLANQLSSGIRLWNYDDFMQLDQLPV